MNKKLFETLAALLPEGLDAKQLDIAFEQQPMEYALDWRDFVAPEIIEAWEELSLDAQLCAIVMAHRHSSGAPDYDDSGETVSDGFGSTWQKRCPMCGKDGIQVVRPGKAQCVFCG